jgi:tetratricopeptide (TPR) repeat protein
MPAAYFALGEALVNMNRAGAVDWPGAVAAYRKAIQLDSRFELAYHRLLAALTHRLASKEDLEAAVALCPKLMELNWTQGLLMRGKAYGKLGQWDKALADFDLVIARNPQYWPVWQVKGDVYAETGQWDNAIAAYSRVVIADPGWPGNWYQRGRVCTKAGKWDLAAADYAEAIRLAPNNLHWHSELAWLLANCPDPLIRNPGRAVELARKGVAGEHRLEWAWNVLGAALYRAGEWKPAIEALEKSIDQRQGGQAFDWYFMAMAHQRLGNTDEARRWYDKAAKGRFRKTEELQRFEAEAKELLQVTDE